MNDDDESSESEPRRRDDRRPFDDLVSGLASRCQGCRRAREVYWDVMYVAVEALAANGGAVWEPVKGMPSQLRCAMGCGSELEAELGGALRRDHVEPFLSHVAEHGATIIAPPGEGGACPGALNPTKDLWLFAPIGASAAAMPFAILHIVQRSGTPDTTRRGYVRFMQQLCELALEGLKRSDGAA